MREGALDLAGRLDHTLLLPDLNTKQIEHFCKEAVSWHCSTICIPPFFTRDAKRLLTPIDTKVKVAVVIGYPMGYSAIAAKSEEIKRATDEGADEFDAVVNIAAIKSGLWNHVQNEIDSLVRAAHMKGHPMKLIVEAGLLTDEELKHVCDIAGSAGVDFISNGSGFFEPKVSVEMIKKLRDFCLPRIQIKANGQIQTVAEAEACIAAGATRIGTTHARQLLGVVSV